MNLIAGSSVKFRAMTSVALGRYSGMAVSYLYHGLFLDIYDLCRWLSLFESACPCPSRLNGNVVSKRVGVAGTSITREWGTIFVKQLYALAPEKWTGNIHIKRHLIL